MTNQAQNPPSLLGLREINVSNPSIVRRSRSEHSVAASDDYYSLSSTTSNYSGRSATASADELSRSRATLRRYITPPSRYRTPAHSHSRDNLASQDNSAPLRGQGQRRHSIDNRPAGEPSQSSVMAPAPSHLRDGGIRRKPIPSTVMEGSEGGEISPSKARSSAAMAIAREESPPTPGIDDAPFIRFALDQLNRDEEVRGSRRYAGLGSGVNGNYPYVEPEELPIAELPAAQLPAARLPIARDDDMGDRYRDEKVEMAQEQRQPLIEESSMDEPPPRNPERLSTQHSRGQIAAHGTREPDVFLPLAADKSRTLHFVPGILRPVWLGLFILAVLAYLVCLLFTAIWSETNTGLCNYGGFGDGKYFVFQYLPTLLGTILLLWLLQIQVAVARIAPFLAMSSASAKSRTEGPELPVFIRGFVLPQLQYFKAGQAVVGIFMLVAWLQLFTIPLLASSFNAHFLGTGSSGQWRWIATQGVIWVVIALYILLLLTLVILLVFLTRQRETGLRWDPRSLADILVMFERSNALAEDVDLRRDPARLGYWRTSQRPNEAFHTYGLPNEQPRQYDLNEGRIQEKAPMRHVRGSADTDLEAGRPYSHRHSKDAMLPRSGSPASDDMAAISPPWFLSLSATLLWAVIAIILLIAFLIVSYLPSTRVSKGFNPGLPAPVNRQGFSSENFLYSFIPALLGELCLLFWLDIDFAFRRLQPFISLLKPNGELAERSLLLSYAADLPVAVTAAAAANGHWRVAYASFITLVAATLPILGGGVFWAQFFIPTQRVRMSAHMPAYYALTFFVVLYALSYLIILPLGRADRELASSGHGGNKAVTFADILALVRHSRILDDVAFHSPASKVDLVTRLLSAPPGVRVGRNPEAAASKISLADSVRGFGNARQRAQLGEGTVEIPRYSLGRWTGRDGREFVGVDRVRS